MEKMKKQLGQVGKELQSFTKDVLVAQTLNDKEQEEGKILKEDIVKKDNVLKLFEFSNEYDPDNVPFDIGIALTHQSASMVYQDTPYDEKQQEELCPCCSKPRKGMQLDYFCDLLDMSHLGPAIPLYFQFLFFSISFLVVLSLINSLNLIIVNVESSNCEKNLSCKVTIFNTLSTINQEIKQVEPLQLALNIGCTIALMILAIVYRFYLRKMEYQIDSRDESASDFTLYVTGIPLDQKEVQIKEYFENLKEKLKMEIKVVKINLCHKIIEFLKIKNKLRAIQKQLLKKNLNSEQVQKLQQLAESQANSDNEIANISSENQKAQLIQEQIQQKNDSDTKLKETQQNQLKQNTEQSGKLTTKSAKPLLDEQTIQIFKEYKKLEQEIEFYEKDTQNLETTGTFIGQAFITFEFEEQVEAIRKHFSQNFFQKYISFFNSQDKLYNGNLIRIYKAPEPEDILWENLEFSIKERVIRRIITIIITLILLAGSFFAILYTSQWRTHVRNNAGNQTYIGLISFISSLIIVVINIILQTVIFFLTVAEKRPIYTEFQIGLAQKITYATVINTVFITFAVNLIQDGRSLTINGGMVQDVSILILTNSVVPYINQFIDFPYLYRVYLQRKYKNNPEARENVNQVEANKLFERPKFNPAYRYASDIKSLFFSSFYAFIIPVAPIIGVVQLSFSYILQKYMITSRQSCPIPVGSKLSLKIIDDFLELIILSYSAGCLAFEIILFGKIPSPITITQCAIAFIYYVAPVDILCESFLRNVKQVHISKNSFFQSQNQFQFLSDYDRCNPMTQAKANHEYQEFIKKNIKHIQNTKGLQKNIKSHLQNDQILQKAVQLTNRKVESALNSKNNIK